MWVLPGLLTQFVSDFLWAEEHNEIGLSSTGFSGLFSVFSIYFDSLGFPVI